MSKMHFIQLARLLSSLKPVRTADNADLYSQWEAFVLQMASFCSQFNVRFDRQRFLAAAGLER